MIKRRKASDSSIESLSEKNVSKEGNSEQIPKNLTETSMSSLSVKEVCNGDKIKTVPKKVSLKRNHLLSKVSTYIKLYLRKTLYCNISNVLFSFNWLYYCRNNLLALVVNYDNHQLNSC